MTRRDAIRWRDDLLKTLAPKTVRDSYLATARAAFAWAADNLDLVQNPFAGVKVRLAKRVMNREKGFHAEEALAILKASREYFGSARETETMTAAKRWTPLLAAYTGARIGELTQLRAEDVRRDGSIDYIRITPEAGTVKSGLYRDVPLHPHIVEERFLDFVKSEGVWSALLSINRSAWSHATSQHCGRTHREVDPIPRYRKRRCAAQPRLAAPHEDRGAGGQFGPPRSGCYPGPRCTNCRRRLR